MKKLISFVLPVYNEELTLPKLQDELKGTLEIIEKKYSVEIIFINDGSKDSSIDILNQMSESDQRIRVIDFSRNFGQQAAVTAGLDYSKGDAVIIMDADLQDPPETTLDMINKWEKGFDVVYATRKKRKDGFFKSISAKIFYRVLYKLSEVKIPVDTGDFRLMDRKVVNEIIKFKETNRYLRGLVSYVGFKQTSVEFERNERYAGVTHYPLKKMVGLSIDGITGFSTIPLRLITQFGILVSIGSFLGIIYALFQRIFNYEEVVAGWTTVMLSVLFIGGVQIVMIGILGSYIGRIYKEVRNRPLYIVSSIKENEKFTKSK